MSKNKKRRKEKEILIDERFADLKVKIDEPHERVDHITEEINRLGEEKVTSRMKTAMADYIIGNSKENSVGRTILNSNRMATVNKREISREGLVDRLEGGEDTFHSLVKQDKHTILTPKVSITEEDIKEVPGLKLLRDEIERLATKLENNKVPSDKIKKTKQVLIEMRKDQYVLLNMYRQPIFGKGGQSGDIGQKVRMDVSLTNLEVVKSLVLNYNSLKIEHDGNLDSDIKWVLEDLDRLINKAFKDNPSLLYILQCKIEGYVNQEIREGLIKYFGKTHTEEYISSLYRNKIPKEIVKVANEEFIDYMFLNHLKGNYKRCTKCGEIKLETNKNFSINRTKSSDYYSICKKCRNKKNK